MKWLLDTNILLRLTEIKHPMHHTASEALDRLRRRDEGLFTTPQNFIEFWAVATRPVENNGLGLTVAEAQEEIERLHDFFPLAPDSPEVYHAWRYLAVTHHVKGHGAHDARLVAVMLVHELTHLLTFDAHDFKKYPEIHPVHPKEIR